MDQNMAGKQRPAPLQITAEHHSTDSMTVAGSTLIPLASTIRGPYELGCNNRISPPSTPPTRSSRASFSQLPPQTPTLKPIAGDITFDFDRAELLGSGLWSNVYKAEIAVPEPVSLPPASSDLITPPTTPQKSHIHSLTHVYAVKTASRPDAKDVFEEEARLLSYITLDSRSSQYVIPFYGLFNSSSSILLHCASTTLDQYATTFSDIASVPALLEVYPAISAQLISGLAFLHSLHVIHADIKPSNVLLDFTPAGIVARYCDFSASLLSPLSPDSPLLRLDPTLPDSPAASAPVSRANSQRKPAPGLGGGTWAFMAPEQLAANPLLNGPSYAADVYALGIALAVFLAAGASPFRAAEDQNIFLLREAIKLGTPLAFARDDVALRPRFRALEASVQGARALQGIGLACKKAKNDRVTALGWKAWVEA